MSKTTLQTSQHFLYMLPMTVTQSSPDDNLICYVLPALWIMSHLHITGQQTIRWR